jgi:alpha-beta hydrolase superfamily lysophospholipase
MNRRTALGFGFAAGASLAASLAESAAPQADVVASVSRARRASFIARRDGTALFYRDWGTGRPVLFVHGAGIDSDLWMNQMATFVNAGFRCIAFDRRGHGRSSDPGGGSGRDALADDIAAIITTLDLKGVAIVGHSMGCGEIVRYLARQDAARVSRVALVRPMLPSPHDSAQSEFQAELARIPVSTLILHGTTDVDADLLRFLL